MNVRMILIGVFLMIVMAHIADAPRQAAGLSGSILVLECALRLSRIYSQTR